MFDYTILIIVLILLCVVTCTQRTKRPKKRNSQALEISKFQETTALISKNAQNHYSLQPIMITDFANYLHQAQTNNILRQQFQGQPKTKKTDCTQGKLSKNLHKNRYKNTLPYDYTRVILKDNDDGDYINANYVDGYKTPKAFIATQAPLASTVHDFWTMICQENVAAIVMLNKLEENECEKYWPDDHSHFRFGPFLITNTSVISTSNYIHRILEVKYDDQTRVVHQFVYLTWSARNVPLSINDFTIFVKELMKVRQEHPIVVHSESGCGRVGMYILCDIVLRMSIEEKQVDFYKTLEQMRNQRNYLVSHLDQYIFCHFVVLEYHFVESLLRIDTSDNSELNIGDDMQDTCLTQFVERLEKATEQYCDYDKDSLKTSSILPDNTPKNINAITVDSFNYPGKFLVTKQPSPDTSTLQKFWNLVVSFKVEMVLCLNRIDDKDKICPSLLPREAFKDWFFNDTTKLVFLSEENNNNIYNTITIKINETDKTEERIVKIMCLKTWDRLSVTPSNITDLIHVCDRIVPYEGKIVVTCYDGTTASGLFVALAFLLAKINTDRKYDVFEASKTVKQSCPQFLKNSEQIKFLFQAASEYVREFNMYEVVV